MRVFDACNREYLFSISTAGKNKQPGWISRPNSRHQRTPAFSLLMLLPGDLIFQQLTGLFSLIVQKMPIRTFTESAVLHGMSGMVEPYSSWIQVKRRSC